MRIPDELKKTIFERVFTPAKGMGLFMTREILEITGIIIRETGIFGKGARFEISVPREVTGSSGKVEAGIPVTGKTVIMDLHIPVRNGFNDPSRIGTLHISLRRNLSISSQDTGFETLSTCPGN